jgi:hypothetical protein
MLKAKLDRNGSLSDATEQGATAAAEPKRGSNRGASITPAQVS